MVFPDSESYSGSDGQQTTKQWPCPFFHVSLALGSVLELLLSPTITSCHIQSTFHCTLQSNWEVVHCPHCDCYAKLALLAAWQANESERWDIEARKRLIRHPADREDGRLVPQNHHLIGVWMPGSFIDQKRNEELKSKGRMERERPWGGKVKGLQSCETSPREWPAFGRGVLISSLHRWAGKNSLSMSWTKAL